MSTINLFTANLTGRQLKHEQSETKKSISAALADYERAIDGAFRAVIQSEDKRARNVANAAKGKYRTSLQVVVNCFPYQTAGGTLCSKKKNADGEYVWVEKKLTASAARGIVRDSLKNFTNHVGSPIIARVVIGTSVK